MSKKEDLVALLQPGDSQDNPQHFISRENARTLKKENKGYFQRSGRVFQLLFIEADWESFAKKYDVRDASSSPGPVVMNAYVDGARWAIPIIAAWA